MVILVNNERFETMACAMAWAKLLGVQVEVRSDEWLERLRSEYEADCGELELECNERYLWECGYTIEEAKEELAKIRKYRPLGLYEVEA